jgi:hypothetical protein
MEKTAPMMTSYLLRLKSLVFAFPLLMTGCALLQQGAVEADERRLLKAGFQEEKVTSFADTETLRQLPPNKVVSVQQSNQTVIYKYADPANGRIFVGNAGNFLKYKELITKERAKNATKMAEIGAMPPGRIPGMAP